MLPGKERMVALLGAAIALLVAALAVGQDLPVWLRWGCLGLALAMIMLMVGGAGSARAELHESQSKLPLRGKRGRIIGTFGVSNDVTAMIVARQSLEKERNNLRTLLDCIPDSIYIRDRGGCYMVVNRALAELVGEPDPDAVTGKTPHDYFPDAEAERFLAEDEAVMEAGETVINPHSAVRGQCRLCQMAKAA